MMYQNPEILLMDEKGKTKSDLSILKAYFEMDITEAKTELVPLSKEERKEMADMVKALYH